MFYAFGFNSFQSSMNFIRTQIGDLIRNETYYQNITKADINDECNDPKNAKIKNMKIRNPDLK